jgi:hypothetical protein
MPLELNELKRILAKRANWSDEPQIGVMALRKIGENILEGKER